ncbi:MAG TPA: class I SAM-dependent methyltransferase [Acidimicrobiales bacterium]|nr:class I SAM-dependent methyltransferase [Acidimicrobiales bacterium]
MSDGTADADPFSPDAVRAAYDTVAEDYEAAFGEDLASLPLDRAVLEAAAATVPDGATALDLGCGTGVAGAVVAGGGVPVVGADLSAGMLEVARSSRSMAVVQADMRRLPFGEGAFALVVAFYVIQHAGRAELAGVLSEVRRVLGDGGAVLVAAHLGTEDVMSEEFLGHRIAPMAGALYPAEELTGLLVEAGFAVHSSSRRGPLDHEYPSQRIYVLARRSG